MGRSARVRTTRVLATIGTAGVVLALLPAAQGSPAEAAPTAATRAVSVSVTGTLLSTAEEPDAPAQYGVRLDSGRIVAVDLPPGTPTPEPYARVATTLRLPAGLTDAAARRGAEPGRTVRQDTAAGRAALRLVRDRGAVARATDLRLAPSSGASSKATSTTTHRLFVAVPTNLGTQARTDAQMVASAGRVAAYWERQANGAIADVVEPTAVVSYASTVVSGDGDCGFSSFFQVVNEAYSKIPGATSRDHVVVFVPPSCPGLGLGVVGRSFADAGGSVVAQSLDLDSTVAHEIGHNYGFAHANLGSKAYWGIYDVMGFAIGKGNGDGYDQTDALSTTLRVDQGITDAGEVADQTTSGTVSLRPRTDATGVRGVRLTEPGSGTTYYLDYRTGAGEDAGNCYVRICRLETSTPFAPGVTVSQPRREGSSRPSFGIDFVKVGAAATSLAAGTSWTSPSGAVTVSVTATSSAAATVSVQYAGATPFAQTGTPRITGDPTYLAADGLSVDPGTWSPAATSYAYEWLVDDQVVSTESTYRPRDIDVDHQVRVRVTATAEGTTPTATTSDPVTVSPATLTFRERPLISGDPVVGATLTASRAVTDQAVSGAQVVRRWLVDGEPVATGDEYVVKGGAVGGRISVVESWTATGFAPATSASDPTATVAPGALVSSKPVVKGSPRAGYRLSATPGTWTKGTTMTYRWSVGGQSVSGKRGSSASYVPATADRGKRITVAVTGTKPGYVSRTRTSAATAAVR